MPQVGASSVRARRDRNAEQLAVGTSVLPRSMGALSLTGTSQMLRRKLAITRSFAFTGTAGGFTSAYCILNTGYGVDGASLQYPGYAKYMAFYSKAWVLDSRWRARFTRDAASSAAVVVGTVVTTNTTAFLGYDKPIENGLSRWTMLGKNPDSATLNGACNHARFLGKPNYLDDPQLYSTVSANVGQAVVLQLFLQAADAATTVAGEVVVELEVDVVFTDPIPFT